MFADVFPPQFAAYLGFDFALPILVVDKAVLLAAFFGSLLVSQALVRFGQSFPCRGEHHILDNAVIEAAARFLGVALLQ